MTRSDSSDSVGHILSSLFVPDHWLKTTQWGGEAALHSTSFAGKKTKNSWKVCLLLKPSVPTQPFVLHTVLALSTPLSLYPAYLFSHLSVAPLYYHSHSLCPLSGSHPLHPLNFSLLYLSHPLYSFYLLRVPLSLPLSLCLSHLFASLASYLLRDTSVLKMGCTDPRCGIQNRGYHPIYVSHPMGMCSDLTLQPLPPYSLCLPNTPFLLSGVSSHMLKVDCYVECSNPTWCCFQPLNLKLLQGVCSFRQDGLSGEYF